VELKNGSDNLFDKNSKLRSSALFIAFDKTKRSAPEGRPVLLVTRANPDLFMTVEFETTP
jgi:hypothetical protein